MKKVYVFLALTSAFFSLFAQTKDNFGYEFYEVPYEFIDIKTTGTKITELSGGQDLVSSPINLGQNFEFYGTEFNQMRVGIDGFITFDVSSTISQAYLNTSLPNISSIKNLVGLYWNDLSNYHDWNDIYYQADADKMIIQWDTLAIVQYGDFITAQIVLDFSEKSIRFNYRTLYDDSNANNYTNWCTVGIQNADGTDGTQMAYDGTFANGFSLESEKSYIIYKPSVFEPIIGIRTGVYIDAIDVPITPQPAEANIYYTLDGSTPTTSSTLYTVPVHITSDCTLKAISEKDGIVSEIYAEERYFIVNQGTATTGDMEFFGLASLANSPYYVNGNITIPTNQCVEIEPGVEIIFTGNYKFIVQGCITANGTENNHITFDRFEALTYHWAGMEFNTLDVSNSNSIINYCDFRNSYAQSATAPDYNGGAIFVRYWDNLTISNCIFENNRADNNGGALFINFADIEVYGNTFTNNSALYGGAIDVRNSAANIHNNLINDNKASYGGGIALNLNTGGTVISENQIIENSNLDGETYGYGGGIYAYTCGANFHNNTISENTTVSSGGGVYLYMPDGIVFENNIVSLNQTTHSSKRTASGYEVTQTGFEKNETGFDGSELVFTHPKPKIRPLQSKEFGSGGGVEIQGGTGSFFNNDIFGNSSAYQGGGIYFESSAVALSGNMIRNNTASSGGGLTVRNSNAVFANNIIIYNNSTAYGDGIYIIDASNPDFYNSVIMYNSGDNFFGDIYCGDMSSMPDFYNSVVSYKADGVDGDYINGWLYTGTMENCHEFFPSFVYDNGNITGIENFSALINNGASDISSLTLPATDILGNPRVNEVPIDIGCFESSEPFTANVLTGAVSGTLTPGVYYAQDNLIVEQDQTLTIEAGTHILFCGNFGLDVYGQITASGTPENPILFSSADTTHFDSHPYYFGGWRNMYIENAANSVFNWCTFSYSKLTNIFPATNYLFGGFAYIYNSSPEFKNCTFEKSNTSAYGAALAYIDCETGGGIVENSKFGNCKTRTYSGWEYTGGEGGAIFIQNSSPYLVGNIFENNVATSGSGGYPKGGAICVYNSQSNIVNNTFAGNYSYNGGALILMEADEISMKNDIDLVNNIFTGNTTQSGSYGTQMFITDETSQISVLNNNIEGGYDNIHLPGGFNGIFTDNIAQNPIFEADYRLAENSPGVDLGLHDMQAYALPETDFYGLARISGVRTDIGASEFQHPVSINYVSENESLGSPNPTKNFLSVNYPIEAKVISTEFYDIYGKKIPQVKFVKTDEGMQTNLSNLVNGIYILKIVTEKQIYTTAIIKQ